MNAHLWIAVVLLSVCVGEVIGADIYLHVGPHKTGSSHVQYFLNRFKTSLGDRGFCFPAATVKDHHKFAMIFHMNNENDLPRFKSWFIDDCLSKGKKLILSSESFSRLNVEAITKMKEFFHGYTFTMIVVHRDWLSKTYSLYTELVKVRNAVHIPFSYFILGIGEFYDGEGFHSTKEIVNNYQHALSSSMLSFFIVDYHGVGQVKNIDIAQVIICQLIGIDCTGWSDQEFDHVENAAPDLHPYHVLHMAQSMASIKYNCQPIEDIKITIIQVCL